MKIDTSSAAAAAKAAASGARAGDPPGGPGGGASITAYTDAHNTFAAVMPATHCNAATTKGASAGEHRRTSGNHYVNETHTL